MNRITVILVITILSIMPAGCFKEAGNPLKIGSQDFTEQKLLAEMMALLAEKEGIRVRRFIPYGDKRQSLVAIQKGDIDAYPEYNGSLLFLSGRPAPQDIDMHSHEAVADSVRELVKPLGLRWMDPFGLNNSYALAVRRDVAINYELSNISDLTRLPKSLHIAVDSVFMSRSTDGLHAMARRYGLTVGDVDVFQVGERLEIYNALVEQRVDVAEIFGTDARLHNYGVAVLNDDLGFFPLYEPAPLVRSDVIENFPRLEKAWGSLAGRIDTDVMRRLNARVEQAGEDYRDVARDYLVQLGLLPAKAAADTRRWKVVLAVSPVTDLGFLSIRAAEAIRKVMPARRLVVQNASIPADEVSSGRARFGLIGVEEFYRIGKDNQPVQVKDLEAVGLVGTRFAHLVARKDFVDPQKWRTIGTGTKGGSSWKVARLVLIALGLDNKVQLKAVDEPVESSRMLANGDVDAVLLMVEKGHAGLHKLLRSGNFRLVNADAFRGEGAALRYPFLREARIPAGIYPNQTEPLDTIAGQVVLATRVPLEEDPVGESGPGFVPGVFTRLPQRLPFETARKIAQALNTAEEVDPILPKSPGLDPETPLVRSHVEAHVASALMNVLAIAFLIAMVILFLRKLPRHPALTSEQKPPEDGRKV